MMMKRCTWAAAMLVAATGAASATVVQPALGVVATESRVAGRNSYSDPNYPLGFHVVSGLGTPGTNVVNYNPAGYFGQTASAVSAYDIEVSGNGTNRTVASGSAAADLRSGQLHFTAQAQRLGTGVNDTSVALIGAGATLSDVLTITGPITSPISIRLSMVVHGGFSSVGPGGAGPNDSANAIGSFALSVISGGNAYAELFLNKLSGGSIQEQDASSYGGKVIMDAGNASSLSFTLYDDVVVTDKNRTIPFLATGYVGLYPDSPGTITADFGNTASLQVSLPAGLGFTSKSGVFLTAPQDSDSPTSVPEPASALLLIVGLIGGWFVRAAAFRMAPASSPFRHRAWQTVR